MRGADGQSRLPRGYANSGNPVRKAESLELAP